MCILCTPRPIYRSTYRPTLDRCIGRHIGRESVDMSTEMCRSTYRPMYIGRVMVDISTEISPIVGRYSGRHSANMSTIDCRRSIGRLSVVYRSSVSYNISQKLRLSVTGVNKAVASRGEMGAVATPPPPQNKLYILNKFAEITLLSLQQQNAYVGNEYTLSIMQCKKYN